jgi:hypothetical protein
MADYGFNSKDPSIGGYAHAAATGFGTGATTSFISSKIGSAVTDNLNITPRFPEPTGRHVRISDHAMAPNVQFWNNVVEGGVDRVLGGAGAYVNGTLMGKDDGDILKDSISGTISGAEGDTMGVRRR